MPTTVTSIASSVRAELARVNISGRQLAADLGWSHDAMRRRLSGGVPFSGPELAEIASRLSLPVARFYETPDEQAEPAEAAS